MKVKKIVWQHRRDFRAIYECEHCGHTEEQAGYDDANFHEHVIPQWTCTKCGQKAPKTNNVVLFK